MTCRRPDINGDLQVNLADLTAFSQDFHGDYDYRSDFHWDGQLDLTDLTIMARGFDVSCP
jgi:hypothetical protein